MKKGLVIISFAFIFLLSMSIVSANFFDWLNGGATRTSNSGGIPPTRFGSDTSPIVPPTSIFPTRTTIFTRTSDSKVLVNYRKSFSNSGTSTIDCPIGFSSTPAKSGGNCCVPS